MNYLDIIIAVLLIVFGIDGLRKGIIIEVATLLALFVGLYGAFHFSDFTAGKLIELVEIGPKYLHVISFVVTFVVLAVLVYLLGRLVKKLVKAISLGFLDKIGGFVVGLGKGVLLCSVAVMLLNVLCDNGFVDNELREESVLYPLVEETVPYVYQGFEIVEEAVENMS
ncbi:MAG: CvpA family protein [Bacteroidales bacterium]|nr:CvpA family protein [Bacteroidales bacterium]